MQFKYNKAFHTPIWMGLIVMIISSGCKKFVQIPPSPNLIVSSQVFADSADANSAVVGLYISMIEYGLFFDTYNGNITLYNGLSADELYSTTGNSDELSAYTNAVLSTQSTSANFWNDSYVLIYKANAIIQGLSGVSTISNSAKNQFIGEAKVIRSFCYFYLTNLFGSVPLVTTTNYQSNAILPGSPVDSVYQQIISDLTSAQSLLTPNYPTAGRVRANQYTATALLARVYLYLRQWSNAATASSQVISSGDYNLLSNLKSVFLDGSKEAILQLEPAYAGYETAEGYVFVPTSTSVIPNYVINSYLLNAYEIGDQRRINWLDSNVVSGHVYYYPYKYEVGSTSNNPNNRQEDYMVFRLAEQYLIRAEAEAQGAGNGTSAAIIDLDTIRARAGLPPYTGATDQTSLLHAVLHERQVELSCEWGHRWFDLIRTGSVDTVMGGSTGVCAAKGGTWSTNWELYPIPLSQLQANSFLVQNPGYN